MSAAVCQCTVYFKLESLADSYFMIFFITQILATLDYETAGLFHFTGPYHSTPNCPIKLEPDFNPSSGVPFYMESDDECSKVASYNMPFFLQRPGPRYESITLAAHEARPGHHTQVRSRTPDKFSKYLFNIQDSK